MSKPYQICILGAGPGTGNLGVTALLYSTVALLQHGQRHCEVTILDYDVANQTTTEMIGGDHVRMHGVRMRFSKQLWRSDHIAFLLLLALLTMPLPKSWRRQLRARNRCLRQLQAANVVASLAGGDSFSDIYGLRRFTYVLLPQLLALACARPLVLLPQSLGPFRGRLAQSLAAFVQRRADKVYSRELNPAATASFTPLFCYDLAFALETTRPGSATILQPPPVGINVSGLLWIGGYNRNNMFALKTNYCALTERIAESILAGSEQPLLLISHTVGDDGESDYAACQALLAILQPRWPGRVSLAPVTADPRQIKHIIGQCDFVIASRMHACIAALSQCIAAVGLAYSPKFRGVLASINAEALVVDPCLLSEAEVITRIHAIYAARQRWQQQLQQIMPRVQAQIHQSMATMLGQAKPEAHC